MINPSTNLSLEQVSNILDTLAKLQKEDQKLVFEDDKIFLEPNSIYRRLATWTSYVLPTGWACNRDLSNLTNISSNIKSSVKQFDIEKDYSDKLLEKIFTAIEGLFNLRDKYHKKPQRSNINYSLQLLAESYSIINNNNHCKKNI